MGKKRRELSPEERERINAERRRKYREDPKWRERIIANNERHNKKKAEAKKDPVEQFDELLGPMQAKWAAEEVLDGQ